MNEPCSKGELVKKEVTTVYFGYLVGRLRQVLEAVIDDKTKLKASETLLMDRMYEWWEKIDSDTNMPFRPYEEV